jgi:L-iditol 2-dehydrogenase
VKAALLSAPRRIELVETPGSDVGPHQVRLGIEQCGLCASELDLWLGKSPENLPAKIGHEVAGTVVEVGAEVKTLRTGDRVAGWIEAGGFAEQAILHEDHCVKVSPHVTYPAVAEPLACVVNAVELASPALGDDVVIVGAGYMGTLVQLVSSLKSPRSITVMDTRPDVLERASELGATRVVNVGTESPLEVVHELTGGHGADITYEVTGVGPGLDLATDVTRMGGKLCIVGFHQGPPRSVNLAKWNWMAFEIVNAHFRDIDTIMRGMRTGIRLVNTGVLDVSHLVTDTFPLDRIDEAFALAMSKPPGFLKAVVEINGAPS